MPQGEQDGEGISDTTATARKLCSFSLTAFTTAVRSAQIPAPYDAFSTLQPP